MSNEKLIKILINHNIEYVEQDGEVIALDVIRLASGEISGEWTNMTHVDSVRAWLGY